MRRAPPPTRANVLHAVTEEILARRDGQLPTDLEHVKEFFPDTDALVDALLLRWHTLLTARLERALGAGRGEPEETVIEAWQQAAEAYRGVRLVLDRLAEHPPTTTIERAVRTTARHDWAAMAVAAGVASGFDEPAVRLGHRLELEARRRDQAGASHHRHEPQLHRHRRHRHRQHLPELQSLAYRVKRICFR